MPSLIGIPSGFQLLTLRFSNLTGPIRLRGRASLVFTLKLRLRDGERVVEGEFMEIVVAVSGVETPLPLLLLTDELMDVAVEVRGVGAVDDLFGNCILAYVVCLKSIEKEKKRSLEVNSNGLFGSGIIELFLHFCCPIFSFSFFFFKSPPFIFIYLFSRSTLRTSHICAPPKKCNRRRNCAAACNSQM
jgi:hypothetical protein